MKPRVYLDNCCFNRPFDDPATPFVRLEIEAKSYVQRQMPDGNIMLVKKEPFDYTRWQETLFEGMSVEEISAEAAALRARTKQQRKTTGRDGA